MKRLLLLAALAAPPLLAACGGDGGAAGPWLTMPDPAAHSARYFPVQAGDTHGPAVGGKLTTCDDCHADVLKGGAPAESFKTFTCTGCHVEIRPGVFHDSITSLAAVAAHAGATVFVPSDPVGYDHACRGCHQSGIAVDHKLTFPLPHGGAAGTSTCTDCHASQTDRTQLKCALCHPHDQAATVTAHAPVPDFSATDSARCARCHGDDTIPSRVATHTAFPIGTGKTHVGAAGGACLACHPALRTGKKAFAADFTRFACLGCHVEVRPGVFHDSPAQLATLHDAGTTFTDATCLDCHKDGAGGAPANHPQLFPVGAGTKHATVTCGQCHGANRKDVAQLKCDTCHAALAGWSTKHTVSGYAIAVTKSSRNATPVAVPMTSPNCLKCHPASQHLAVATHPGGDDGFGTGNHRSAGCLTCHTGLLTTQPYPATNWKTEGGCNTCH